MKKRELVNAMALRAGVSQADAERCLEAFLSTVCSEVAEGNEVNVTGYMKFSSVQRAARTGRNPRTGETIAVPASRAVKITAGAKLKDAVKG